jgi:hypothetical protein
MYIHTHTWLSSCRAGLAQRPPHVLVTPGPHRWPPPPAACRPAATFAQLCLVFSCLPSFVGGAVHGAMNTACTWASARGEPAKQPPHRLPGWKGETQGWARPPKSLGGVHISESQTGTHTQQDQAQAALPFSERQEGWALSRALWGQYRHWPLSQRMSR